MVQDPQVVGGGGGEGVLKSCPRFPEASLCMDALPVIMHAAITGIGGDAMS